MFSERNEKKFVSRTWCKYLLSKNKHSLQNVSRTQAGIAPIIIWLMHQPKGRGAEEEHLSVES